MFSKMRDLKSLECAPLPLLLSSPDLSLLEDRIQPFSYLMVPNIRKDCKLIQLNKVSRLWTQQT